MTDTTVPRVTYESGPVPWSRLKEYPGGHREAQILVATYTEGDAYFRAPTTLRVRHESIWEGYRDTELVNALGWTDDHHEAGVIAAWNAVCHFHDCPRVFEQDMAETLAGELELATVFLITCWGTLDEIGYELARYAMWIGAALAKDCDKVGGDDSYYDYFPDGMNGFLQLCKGLGEPAKLIYNKIYREVTAPGATYDPDTEHYEEVIPVWKEEA